MFCCIYFFILVNMTSIDLGLFSYPYVMVIAQFKFCSCAPSSWNHVSEGHVYWSYSLVALVLFSCLYKPWNLGNALPLHIFNLT